MYFKEWLWFFEPYKKPKNRANGGHPKVVRSISIKSMLLYPIPLWEAKEASILDGFGDKVCADIQSLLEKHAESLKLDPKQLLGS